MKKEKKNLSTVYGSYFSAFMDYLAFNLFFFEFAIHTVLFTLCILVRLHLLMINTGKFSFARRNTSLGGFIKSVEKACPYHTPLFIIVYLVNFLRKHVACRQ